MHLNFIPPSLRPSLQSTIHLMQLIPHAWNLLVTGLDFYVKTSVTGAEEAEELVDEDGVLIGFEYLIGSIFELVMELMNKKRTAAMMADNLPDLCFYVISYMQMTDDQVEGGCFPEAGGGGCFQLTTRGFFQPQAELWESDVSQYVEDEDDETFSQNLVGGGGVKQTNRLLTPPPAPSLQSQTARARRGRDWRADDGL